MAKADPYELGRCTSEPTQEPKIQHAWFNRKKREWSTYSQSSSYSAPLSKRTVECLLTFSIVASRFSYLLVVVRIYACTKQPFDADCHRLLLLFAVSITPSPKQPIYRERWWRAERLSPQMDFCTYYDLLGNHQPIFVHHHVPPSQVWTYALKIRSSCLSFFTFFRMSHWKVANSMGYSYDFPMISYGFNMMFLWFSYDFPMVFPWDDAQMKHIAEYHERRLEAEPGLPELHPGSQKLSMFHIMWSTVLLSYRYYRQRY